MFGVMRAKLAAIGQDLALFDYPSGAPVGLDAQKKPQIIHPRLFFC
jgi:hypothetical protein